MIRAVLSQLRHRRARALTLLAGICLAATAFTVLTGASRSQQLQVRGTVARNYRTAYDILVRPRGSRTALERQRGVVRPGVLSGIFGGITLKQWQTVLHTPGVSVAAPIAVVGYALPEIDVPIDLTRYLPRGGPALFRVAIERITDQGLTRIADTSIYSYITHDRFARPASSYYENPWSYAPREILPSGHRRPMCAEQDEGNGPWSPLGRGGDDASGDVQCISTVNGIGKGRLFPRGHAGVLVPTELPFVIAAIDPAQEAKLDHLNRAVVSGRYLTARDKPPNNLDSNQPTVANVPVLAPTQVDADEQTEVTVTQLPASAPRRLLTGKPMIGYPLARFLARQPGRRTEQVMIRAGMAQRVLLRKLRGAGAVVYDYWTVGPTRYRTTPDGDLQAQTTTTNPTTAWLGGGGYLNAPQDARDRAFRVLTDHQGNTGTSEVLIKGLHAVGTFDPSKLPGFGATVSSALATFRYPGLPGADAQSRRRLRGRDLLPNANLAGYPTQPPLMLTDLRSLPAFEGENYMPNAAAAPISAIRVDVADAGGIGAASRERVRLAAQRIQQRTGLDVDLTIGSSPQPLTIDLPAGKFGRPALAVTEDWVKKGVAVAILDALNKQSLILFILILVVCTLFVANASSAAVRTRRTELGVLGALGWERHQLFEVMLLEVTTIGLAAGVLAAAIALPLGAVAGYHPSLARALLAIPAAVILSLLAGLVPATRAAVSAPIDAIRPAVTTVRRRFRPQRIGALALINTLRAPGRTLLGAASLAVGICALTLLLSATLAFHDVLVGTLLGSTVSVQISTSDYIAVASIIVLGIGAVTDVLYLNMLDRAGELATLRATGWEDGALVRLVAEEGLWIGALGSTTGAAVGLAGAAIFSGSLPLSLVLTAVAAALAGTILGGVISSLPARAQQRFAPASLLTSDT